MSRTPIVLALLLVSAGALASGANSTIWGPSTKPIEVSEALRMHADFSPQVDDQTPLSDNSAPLDCGTFCDESCDEQGWMVCISAHDYCEVTCYGELEDNMVGGSARIQAAF